MALKMLIRLGNQKDEYSENFIKEMEHIRKYQIEEVIELKNTLTEVKNTLEGFNSRPGEAEELKDKVVALNQSEQQKAKRVRKGESNLRDLQDSIRWTNIFHHRVPRRRERERGESPI